MQQAGREQGRAAYDRRRRPAIHTQAAGSQAGQPGKQCIQLRVQHGHPQAANADRRQTVQELRVTLAQEMKRSVNYHIQYSQ